MKDVTIELEDRAGALAEMGVVLYSDHDNQLILVVDDVARGREVSEAWMREVAPVVDP